MGVVKAQLYLSMAAYINDCISQQGMQFRQFVAFTRRSFDRDKFARDKFARGRLVSDEFTTWHNQRWSGYSVGMDTLGSRNVKYSLNQYGIQIHEQF